VTFEELPSEVRAEVCEVFGKAFLDLAKKLRGGRRPGRPRYKDITEAMRMEAAGVSRKEIYRRLGKATPLAQHALKEAMRQRRRREPKSLFG
jgi:hypothetical protein